MCTCTKTNINLSCNDTLSSCGRYFFSLSTFFHLSSITVQSCIQTTGNQLFSLNKLFCVAGLIQWLLAEHVFPEHRDVIPVTAEAKDLSEDLTRPRFKPHVLFHENCPIILPAESVISNEHWALFCFFLKTWSWSSMTGWQIGWKYKRTQTNGLFVTTKTTRV